MAEQFGKHGRNLASWRENVLLREEEAGCRGVLEILRAQVISLLLQYQFQTNRKKVILFGILELQPGKNNYLNWHPKRRFLYSLDGKSQRYARKSQFLVKTKSNPIISANVHSILCIRQVHCT
jgi:hypothetical protein